MEPTPEPGPASTADGVAARPPRASDTPFRRGDLARRIGPFALVAALAELSLALPPGPSSMAWSIASIALLAASAALVFVPWQRLPGGSEILVPLCYCASVLSLMFAAGGSSSGVGIVILVPAVWTALYHRPGSSLVIVLAIFACEVLGAVYPVAVSDSVLARRVIFWVLLVSLISFATHELRSRIRATINQRDELVSQRGEALAVMSRSVVELERRNREARLLNELGDLLPACVSEQETYGVIEHVAVQLFEDGGALSIFNASRNLLEVVLGWGPPRSTERVFSPNDCLALRLGRSHASGDGGLNCTHLLVSDRLGACVPMIAQGDTVGVLHVFGPPGSSANGARASVDGELQRLALTVGEQIGMSIANFRLRESLRNQSIRDPLTSLFNRRYMEETFTRELARAEQAGEEIAVVQIDIDHFKEFNDAHGHDVGDALLRSVGSLLLSLFRGYDVPCRYGGEEFTVILPSSSLGQAERRAEELRALASPRYLLLSGRTATGCARRRRSPSASAPTPCTARRPAPSFARPTRRSIAPRPADAT